MTTDDSAARRSPDELQDEIDRTREELGATVDALAAKLDVKTRVRENPRPAVISLAAVAAVVGVLVWWRRSR